VCSRTLGEAEQTAQDIVGAGGAAAATRLDISDRKSCRDLIEFAVERYRKIDVLQSPEVTLLLPIAVRVSRQRSESDTPAFAVLGALKKRPLRA
jgi:hypothetical protein